MDGLVSNQDNLSSVDVASMGDFDSEDFNDASGFDSPWRSCNGTLGTTHARGSFRMRLGFSAGLSYSHTGGVIK